MKGVMETRRSNICGHSTLRGTSARLPRAETPHVPCRSLHLSISEGRASLEDSHNSHAIDLRTKRILSLGRIRSGTGRVCLSNKAVRDGAGTRGEATGMWDKYRHTGLKDRDGDGHAGLGYRHRLPGMWDKYRHAELKDMDGDGHAGLKNRNRDGHVALKDRNWG